MKTWNSILNKDVETPKEMLKFFEEIEKVCKKYNLSISHEDVHGAFEIERYNENNIRWLKDANKNF